MATMASASSCRDIPSHGCGVMVRPDAPVRDASSKGRIVQGTYHQRDAYQKDASFDGRNVSELLFRDISGIIVILLTEVLFR